MLVHRYFCSQVKSNSYFAIGLFIGVVLALQYTGYEEDFACEYLVDDGHSGISSRRGQLPTTDGYEPNFVQSKRVQQKKVVKSLQRPRYYSTELGIRDKLFVGVLTTEENINKHAVAINKTAAHLVNKIKFFITASIVKTNLSLTNIVGFTDTRELLKPFHVLKYILDNYLNDYDYFYLMSDAGFVNARRLLDMVSKISVSEDVYLGTVPEPESHYCSLDAGMLLSNSILLKVKDKLDWCVRNAYSKEHFENIGRCVTYSTGLKCTKTIQDQHLTSFKLPSKWNLHEDLRTLTDNSDFNNAISVYPIEDFSDIYNFQLYFSRLNLEKVNREIESLSRFVSANSAKGLWPPGIRTDPTLPAVQPPDRFHQPRYSTLNESYHLMPDDFTNIKKHTDAEKKDIDYVIDAIVLKVENENPSLKYHSLINGYRRFDPSRGMSYIFDMQFMTTDPAMESKIVFKRLEAFKPLGKASILPVPYVTESTRIILILPIWLHEINSAMEFIKQFETTFMERKEKIFLLTVLMYPAEAISKGPEDAFTNIKSFAIDLSEKYKSDGLKVAWLSIRLPSSSHFFEMPGIMSIAMLDLALRKVPLDSLILFGKPQMKISYEFLNRVRMNTIPEFQIFSVIGFQQYHPSLATSTPPSKGSGRFASWDHSILSFYSKDYVSVRKSIQDKFPIVRADKDVETLISKAAEDIESVFEMFVKYSPNLHAFRAVEAGVTFKYDETAFCPPGEVYKNSSIVESDSQYDNVFNFGDISFTEKCLNDLAKNNFEPITFGSRNVLAKLIFESEK